MWLGSIEASLKAGLVVRLLFMAFGVVQDNLTAVKYTDIDYHVFTDAARYVSQGESPYTRATYRYTPLLAWLMVPNVLLFPLWGKLIFILCDVFCGYLLYHLTLDRGTSKAMGLVCSWLWLFNPLPITVSSRGNAESIMAALVLLTLFCIMRRRTVSAAVVYGLSVHFKIYPVTYALPIYFVLGADYLTPNRTSDSRVKQGNEDSIINRFIALFWPNTARLTFVFVSVTTFVTLTGLCYICYGWEFLHETYLYHITRTDTRHNFSVYFYLLYLASRSPGSLAIGLATFLPQVALLVTTSFKYHKDVIFACFVNTFVFVAFNKVCTSQYFLWYLCLLPLVVPYLTLSRWTALLLITGWFGGQAVWLRPAYLLEFEGENTFLWIWWAGLVFFVINMGILCTLVSHYHQLQLFYDGHLTQGREMYKLSRWFHRYVEKSKTAPSPS